MKEQFFYNSKYNMIFYTNEFIEKGHYYAAWAPGGKDNNKVGYSWDTESTTYSIGNRFEVKEKYFILRGWECRPPKLK